MGRRAQRKRMPGKETDPLRRDILKVLGAGTGLAFAGGAGLLAAEYFGEISFDRAMRTGRWQDYFDAVLENPELKKDLLLEFVDKIYWDADHSGLRRVCDDGIRIFRNDMNAEYYETGKDFLPDNGSITIVSPYVDFSLSTKDRHYLIFLFPQAFSVIETEDDMKSVLEHEGQHTIYDRSVELFGTNISKEELQDLWRKTTEYRASLSECIAYGYQLLNIANGKYANISKGFVINNMELYNTYYANMADYSKRDDMIGNLARDDIQKLPKPEDFKKRLSRYLD